MRPVRPRGRMAATAGSRQVSRTRISSTRRTRRRRSRGVSHLQRRASSSLKRYKQASLVAVAFTGLLLMVISPEALGTPRQAADSAVDPVAIPDTVSVIQDIPVADLIDAQVPAGRPVQTGDATEEATGALRNLWLDFESNVPKYLIALGILALAWLAIRILRLGLRFALARWERADAITALTGVVIWLLAAGVVLSVVLGDIRALAGSLGFIGLALSWSLQTPIESFTGWVMNSFKSYYRVGDRISVGEVFGDVYRIDFLNTTLWEVGGRDQPPGWIQAEQPTGRLITFPNNEVLNGTVINYTRDFPFVWDELTISVATESDLTYAISVLQRVAERVLGDYMATPANDYQALLRREGLESNVSPDPQVYAALTDWSANLTIRYLVDARSKRSWKSRMVIEVTDEMNLAEHREKILAVYPRHQVQLVRSDGVPADVNWAPTSASMLARQRRKTDERDLTSDSR